VPSSGSPRADVCAIVVSHDSRGWLDAALRSLAAHAGDINLEAIVVDNGSDGAGRWAAESFDFVRAVECENRGFGHANNRGLEGADARYVLFLNPDTEVVAGEIGQLVATLERMPEVGLAGVRQVRPDGTLTLSMRRFPSVGRAFAEAVSVEKIPLARRHGGERVLDPAEYERIGDCDWTSGSVMLARAEAIEELGGFDERFFLFSEETDLCRRIKGEGWRIVHLPEVTVCHHEQEHWTNPRLQAQSAYARLQYARKHLRHPGAYRSALMLRYGIQACAYSLPRLADPGRRAAARASFGAVRADRAVYG
jgi:GT2 family glycosyltransferase